MNVTNIGATCKLMTLYTEKIIHFESFIVVEFCFFQPFPKKKSLPSHVSFLPPKILFLSLKKNSEGVFQNFPSLNSRNMFRNFYSRQKIFGKCVPKFLFKSKNEILEGVKKTRGRETFEK
jgi:hypothetical protein